MTECNPRRFPMTRFQMTKMMAKWTTAIVGCLLPSRCRAVAAAAAVGLALCCAAWAQHPEPLATEIATPPQAVWTHRTSKDGQIYNVYFVKEGRIRLSADQTKPSQ